MIRAILFTIVCVTAAGANAQQQYVRYLQEDSLRAIGECTTVKCVDAIMFSAPYIDPPLKLIAASKVHRLNGEDAQRRLLAALPADPVAFWFCYSVTVPALGERFTTVRELYDTYFPAAATAAAETGDVADFMKLAAFADGEMAASIAEELDGIRARNRPAYCKAMNRLHDAVTRHLLPCSSAHR